MSIKKANAMNTCVDEIRMMKKQSGSALIISLIILLVLTLLGISAMSTTYLEEKMTGNLRDQQVAFQAAESVIFEAQQYIEGIATVADFNGTNGLYGQADAEPDFFDDATWTGTNSVVYAGTIPEVSENPRYVIKYLGITESASPSLGTPKYGARKIGDTSLFRITVKGSGSSPEARVLIQTHYGKVL